MIQAQLSKEDQKEKERYEKEIKEVFFFFFKIQPFFLLFCIENS
jgi:hypothetical protein